MYLEGSSRSAIGRVLRVQLETARLRGNDGRRRAEI